VLSGGVGEVFASSQYDTVVDHVYIRLIYLYLNFLPAHFSATFENRIPLA
jgi:hypothetical protein